MKIVVLVRILWTAGTSRIAIHQARALAELGHDVEIVFIRSTSGGDLYRELLRGLAYRVLNSDNDSIFVPVYDWLTGVFMPSRVGAGRLDYNLIRGAWRQLRGQTIDLIVCHDQWGGLAGYLAKRHLGVPYCVYMHEKVTDYPWVKGPIRSQLARLASWYERSILKSASAVFGVTDRVAATIEKKHGIKTIGLLPGLEWKGSEGNKPEAGSLVALSYWSDVKRPEGYLDFIEKLPNFRLKMLGNWIAPDFKAAFEIQLEKRGLKERVRIIDSLSESAKLSYLRKAEFMVRFGWGEAGVATGTLEALEVGLPVIVNDDLGISEEIMTHGLGYVLTGQDYSSVTPLLMNRDTALNREGARARIEGFVKAHSWKDHATRLLAMASPMNRESLDLLPETGIEPS